MGDADIVADKDSNAEDVDSEAVDDVVTEVGVASVDTGIKVDDNINTNDERYDDVSDDHEDEADDDGHDDDDGLLNKDNDDWDKDPGVVANSDDELEIASVCVTDHDVDP